MDTARIDHSQRYAVLFVDDEDHARKYFERALRGAFPIITAADAVQADAVLHERGDEVGVLVTDQRMPGEKGVDLLRRVRETWPHVVRILTTAHPDIDAAIDAVNRGEVHRYIPKPWNPAPLREELCQALELSALRRARDALVNEKLELTRRRLPGRRGRDLIVMASVLGGIRYPLHAIRDFLDGLSRLDPLMAAAPVLGTGEVSRFEFDEAAETGRRLAVAAHVKAGLDRPLTPQAFGDQIDLARTLDRAASGVEGTVTVRVTAPGDSLVGSDEPLAARLSELLVAETVGLSREGGTVDIDVEARGEGVTVAFTGAAMRWPADTGSLLSSPPGTDVSAHPLHAKLLTACHIAAHHGGRLEPGRSADGSLRLDLWLPREPAVAVPPPLPAGWLESILLRCED